jgi:hypothetical protein
MVCCQAGRITWVTDFDISSTVNLWSLLSGDWIQYLSLQKTVWQFFVLMNWECFWNPYLESDSNPLAFFMIWGGLTTKDVIHIVFSCLKVKQIELISVAVKDIKCKQFVVSSFKSHRCNDGHMKQVCGN